MSGVNTPSRKLSRTTTRTLPPRRRNAFSCRSAQTRELDQQPNRLSTVAQRHHEQTRPPVLAALRIENHRSSTVIDLRLLARGSDDHRSGLEPFRRTNLVGKSFDALITTRKSVFTDQVLP